MTLPFKISRTAVILWSLAILVVLLDAGIYFMVVKPREEHLAALEKEYLLKREERKPIKEGSGGIDDRLRLFYGQIPKWEEFTKVMGEVYNRAESLNLFVESATYQSAEIKGTDVVKVAVSMPVTGSYGEIKRFIYYLETSPHLFIIEEISLSKGKGEEGDEVSLLLTIKAHFNT